MCIHYRCAWKVNRAGCRDEEKAATWNMEISAHALIPLSPISSTDDKPSQAAGDDGRSDRHAKADQSIAPSNLTFLTMFLQPVSNGSASAAQHGALEGTRWQPLSKS